MNNEMRNNPYFRAKAIRNRMDLYEREGMRTDYLYPILLDWEAKVMAKEMLALANPL